jgi:hypothetical protein
MPTVTIPQSTAERLFALALANKTTVEALFARFAEAMVDDAGRREGSWEAESVNRFRAAHAPRQPVDHECMFFVQTGGWLRGFIRGERMAGWEVCWTGPRRYRIGGEV